LKVTALCDSRVNFSAFSAPKQRAFADSGHGFHLLVALAAVQKLHDAVSLTGCWCL